MNKGCTQILAGAVLAWSMLGAVAAEPPVIPVGLDAYRQWERWPYQQIRARAYMRSTYERTGGNQSAAGMERHRVIRLGSTPTAAQERMSRRKGRLGSAVA